MADLNDVYEKLEDIRRILAFNFLDPKTDTHEIINHTIEIGAGELVELEIDVPPATEMFIDSLQMNNDPDVLSIIEIDGQVFSNSATFSRNDIGIPGRTFTPKKADTRIIIKLLNTTTSTKYYGLSIELRMRRL